MDPYVIADQIIECQPYSMCLCGGEPLVWEPFFDIVRHLYSGGLRSIGIVSNGYLVTKENIARLNKAGLDNIQFSMDGFRPETHDWLRQKPDSHRRVLNAIEYATKEGFDVAVAFCPTRFNVNEIGDAIDLLVEKGVKQIRCQPFMPLGNGFLNAGQLTPTEEQYFLFKWTIKRKDKEYSAQGIRFEWGDPLEHISIFSHQKSLMHIMSVCEDGAVELSPYIPVRIGHIGKHSLLEYFNMGLMEKAWQHPVVKEYAKTLSVIRGMTLLKPRPYFDPPILLDLLN
jgi:MoaA/NifB/PqqE/SkfB family radical SAM enzyme